MSCLQLLGILSIALASHGAWIGKEYWSVIDYNGYLEGSIDDFAILTDIENFYVAYWIPKPAKRGFSGSFGYARIIDPPQKRCENYVPKICGWFPDCDRQLHMTCSGFRVLSVPKRYKGSALPFKWIPAAHSVFKHTIGYRGHRIALYDPYEHELKTFGDARALRRVFTGVTRVDKIQSADMILSKDLDDYYSNVWLLNLTVPERLPTVTAAAPVEQHYGQSKCRFTSEEDFVTSSAVTETTHHPSTETTHLPSENEEVPAKDAAKSDEITIKNDSREVEEQSPKAEFSSFSTSTTDAPKTTTSGKETVDEDRQVQQTSVEVRTSTEAAVESAETSKETTTDGSETTLASTTVEVTTQTTTTVTTVDSGEKKQEVAEADDTLTWNPPSPRNVDKLADDDVNGYKEGFNVEFPLVKGKDGNFYVRLQVDNNFRYFPYDKKTMTVGKKAVDVQSQY